MASMEILYKSEEIVYPAKGFSHPSLHRLSETDQLRYTVPQLYFYKQGPVSLELFKAALSKTLTIYYPLAGRLVERSETSKKADNGGENDNEAPIGGRMDVSCLDQGVLFVEAWSNGSLDAYLPTNFQPLPHAFAHLHDQSHEDFLLRVQVTHFSCGGLCLCVQAHHAVVDGVAITRFTECWMELANGKESPTSGPHIIHDRLEVMYKPKSVCTFDPSINRHPRPTSKLLGIVNKVFLFSPEFIKTLKIKAGESNCNYTTFECLLAYLWKALTIAREVAPNKKVSMLFGVDGRKILEPPLPSSYLGNVVFTTSATVLANDLFSKELPQIASLVKEAKSKVTDEHIRSELEWSLRQPFPIPSGTCSPPDISCVVWKGFSLCKFNFGWGSPLCCRLPYRPYPCDFILLLPSSLSDAHIEALISLEENHMCRLESIMFDKTTL